MKRLFWNNIAITTFQSNYGVFTCCGNGGGRRRENPMETKRRKILGRVKLLVEDQRDVITSYVNDSRYDSKVIFHVEVQSRTRAQAQWFHIRHGGFVFFVLVQVPVQVAATPSFLLTVNK